MGLVFTFLLPGIAQAYWLWQLWPATATWSHPLTVMCAAWLALVGSGFGRRLYSSAGVHRIR
jgi:TRAP-type C4-dicarboxylate transport system permease small subunit